MVIPTTYPALRDPEVYENPDVFDPERYYTGDAEEKGAKNWLVFGTGPHYCIGQHYAMLNLALMVGKFSLLMDWKHHATPISEEIKVFATIFPMVGNLCRNCSFSSSCANMTKLGRLPIDICGEKVVRSLAY